MLRRLPLNSFVRNVLILISGTVAGQAIVALALPVLTRLYQPEAFSVLAGFESMMIIVVSISCLRFNVAIPLPKEEKEAADLFFLSVLTTTVVSIAFATVIFSGVFGGSTLIRQDVINEHGLLLSIAVWFAGVFIALQSWSSRKRAFKRIARTKVVRAIWGVGTQIGHGMLNPVPFGMVLGHTVLHGFGAGSLAWQAWRDDRADLACVSISGMFRAARTYWRYPVFSTPDALLNSAGTNVPILMIVAQGPPAEAGFLFLAMKLLGLPVSLIGRSVSQVYVSEAGDRLREGTLAAFTGRTILSLAKLGFFPFAAMAVLAPLLAEPLLGTGWERTGQIIAWMVPWFFLQFITAPMAVFLLIISHNALALALQAMGLVLRILAVQMALTEVPERVSVVFALSSALFYLLYLIVILWVLYRVHRRATTRNAGGPGGSEQG